MMPAPHQAAKLVLLMPARLNMSKLALASVKTWSLTGVMPLTPLIQTRS